MDEKVKVWLRGRFRDRIELDYPEAKDKDYYIVEVMLNHLMKDVEQVVNDATR